VCWESRTKPWLRNVENQISRTILLIASELVELSRDAIDLREQQSGAPVVLAGKDQWFQRGQYEFVY
jgi:hypothetical protein